MKNSTTSPVRVALVGCGAISETYLENARRFGKYFELIHCSDLLASRSKGQADRHKVSACGSLEEALANPEVELVLNLTVPLAHAEVSLAALGAGKHVYSEKPLAANYADASEVVRLAAEKKLYVGSAPDTFLGASHQEARAIIDAGVIGKVIGGCAFMLTPGPESWHPDPEFFYKPGAGPLFDMAPYYISCLVNMLGPVVRVCASAQVPMAERPITSKPKTGQVIQVEVPTHVAAVLDFAGGAVITVVTSFNVQASSVPNIELYGTAGSLQVPDPNTFSGDLLLRTAGGRRWKRIRHRGRPYRENSRGVGLADMARAIRTGRSNRTSAELALHVVEVMEGIHRSSAESRHVTIASSPERPEPFTDNLPRWTVP